MTKNLERKKKEQIQGGTNRRRSFFNPTIQHVIVNLYTRFDVSIVYVSTANVHSGNFYILLTLLKCIVVLKISCAHACSDIFYSLNSGEKW